MYVPAMYNMTSLAHNKLWGIVSRYHNLHSQKIDTIEIPNSDNIVLKKNDSLRQTIFSKTPITITYGDFFLGQMPAHIEYTKHISQISNGYTHGAVNLAYYSPVNTTFREVEQFKGMFANSGKFGGERSIHSDVIPHE
jgi:hypothetical protein